jgi:hypothetical protein
LYGFKPVGDGRRNHSEIGFLVDVKKKKVGNNLTEILPLCTKLWRCKFANCVNALLQIVLKMEEKKSVKYFLLNENGVG